MNEHAAPERPRVLRTDEEIWQAGLDAAKGLPPLTEAQIDRIAPLLAAHLPALNPAA